MTTGYNSRNIPNTSYTGRPPITSLDFVTWDNSLYTWDNIPFTWDNANEGTVLGTRYGTRPII